jgi:predicted ATP-grasp superfamily ATP-dependent carboligase
MSPVRGRPDACAAAQGIEEVNSMAITITKVEKIEATAIHTSASQLS